MREVLTTVRDALTALEETTRAAAEARVASKLMPLLGGTAQVPPDPQPQRAALLAAIERLRAALDPPTRETTPSARDVVTPPVAAPPPVAAVSATVPVAVAAPPPPAPSAPVVAPAPAPAPTRPRTIDLVPEPTTGVNAAVAKWTDADAARVASLAEELESVKDDAHMHAIRLSALVQAIVAEIRMLQAKNPPYSAGRTLDHLIRVATAVRSERNLSFIVGLKRTATGDWPRLVRDARAKVSAFDADADAPPEAKSEQTPSRKKDRPEDAPVEEHAHLFPQLMALASPVVLAGGIKKNEVLDSMVDKHGIAAEWVAMQSANPRAADSLVDRIKHGKIGAVVMLEALTGTTQVQAVVGACKVAGVPFAYGGAAGTGSLREALSDLEKQLGGATAAANG